MSVRKRIRLAVGRMAGALSSSMEDREPLDEESLGWIRARLSASSGTPDPAAAAWLLLDARLLLDEVDRLRYEVSRTPRDDR